MRLGLLLVKTDGDHSAHCRQEKSAQLTRKAAWIRIMKHSPQERLGRSMSGMPKEDPMKKFMVLYMASGAEFEKMMKNSTPEQQKKGMDAWMKWMNANKASLVEGGAPLGKTKRVDQSGASNTKNEIGGYSVVQAESHDAATKIFGKDHPHLQMPGAWIEIVEIMPLPGM
jgi:hypothetical protein